MFEVKEGMAYEAPQQGMYERKADYPAPFLVAVPYLISPVYLYWTIDW